MIFLILAVIALVIALSALTSGSTEGEYMFVVFMFLTIVFFMVSLINYYGSMDKKSRT